MARAKTCAPPRPAHVHLTVTPLAHPRLRVMLFMKGTKLFPQCGFSNTAVQILNAVTPNQAFETFDVLADNEIREGIKQYSNWPTIPQCYVDGEFIGGADLLIEMYQNGELQEMVEKAAAE
jgi:monothiol glutaredoxin